MRAIGYIRVSTEDQAESGLGLEAQTFALRQWADRSGLELVGPYMDECSGATRAAQRPGLSAALGDIHAGDVLVVAKRDRLGRDVMNVALIESAVGRLKGRVASAAGEGTDGDDPASVTMRGMIDLFAQYERLLIQSRTKAALAAKKRRNERIGRIPYGKNLAPDGLHLVDDPVELAAVARAQDLRHAGLTYKAIAEVLTAEGFPTKSGQDWSISSIFRLNQRAS